MNHNAGRVPGKLAAFALAFVLVSGLQAPSAQASHLACQDGRTNQSSWFISGGVPDAWTDALVNGVLVWDNIPGISHDFIRYQGPPADWTAFRGSIDGKYGTFALVPADHAVVKYDTDETWHLNVNVAPGAAAVDLFSVAAHESGHILSLAHSDQCYGVGDFNQYAPTMFGGYDYGLKWFRTLEDYDRNHATTIYP